MSIETHEELLRKADEASKVLINKASENARALLVSADKASKTLINKASENAMVLLVIAAETTVAAVADEVTAEAAKMVLSKAVDDAKMLLSKAVDDANALLCVATETAKALLSKAVDDSNALLSVATETAEALLARVKLLEGIIPICQYCKKIRDDAESWHQLEIYITKHSEAMFSHGICPECYKTHSHEWEKQR